MSTHTLTPPPADTLLELELRVARRADELARQAPDEKPLNLECWLQAEAEIFAEFRSPPLRYSSRRHARS